MASDLDGYIVSVDVNNRDVDGNHRLIVMNDGDDVVVVPCVEIWGRSWTVGDMQSLGHVMLITSGLVWCRECGHYALRSPKNCWRFASQTGFRQTFGG